jgi:hypothetical protein
MLFTGQPVQVDMAAQVTENAGGRQQVDHG